VLGNPKNRSRAVPLTYDQFRYAFANTVGEEEANELYETFAVPAAGEPLFQATTANLNSWTEDKVDHENPERGPLLIISGEKDHTVPAPSRRPPTRSNAPIGCYRIRRDRRAGALAHDRQRLA